MANNEQDDNGVDYVNQTNDQTKNAGKKVANNTKKIGKTFVKLLTKLPILLPLLVFIFIIIYVFALYGFLSSMPGMFLGKLKETGMSFWRGFTGFITGKFDYTDSEDVVKLAQYLQNQGYDVQGYGFGDVKYTDDSENTFTSGKTKQIEEVMDVNYRKGYLHSYIAASEETYQLAKFSVWGSIKTGGTKIINGLKSFANMFGCHFDIIDTSIKEESTGLLNIRGIDESNIKVNREGEKLELYTSTAMGRRFGSIFSYDLSGWTSMYGRPTELFIALHLATGMPDLTYEIATNKDFNTKVNINVQHVTINYDTDEQLEVQKPNGEIIHKSDIEAAYYEHVIDEVQAQYDATGSGNIEKRRRLMRLINKLKSYRGNIEKISDFLYQLNIYRGSISMASIVAYRYNPGIGSNMSSLRGEGGTHLPGVNCEQLEELMNIVFCGKDGIKRANLPYIANVTKHWFYEDIEFTVGENGVYHASRKAIKDIKYNGEGTVLENYNIMIWDALLTDEDGTGIFYQVNEPYVHGPNEYIEKLFHEKYYRYDGTIERAHAIAKAELLNKGHGPGYTYIFNGEKWQLINSDKSQNIETKEISDTYEDALPEKQQPSFGTPTDTLSAFNILKQVQTEDSDAIYRMLKELATSEAIEGHIEKESILEDLKQVLIWPFYTDNDLKEWNVSKDLNEYGIIIDDVEGEQIVMPGDGTITTDGDKVIIEFDTLKSNENDKAPGTVQILTKKYVEDDFYRIDPDIVKGKKMIIQGMTVDATGNVARGEIIGVAGAQVKIVMQREDKSIIGKTTDENADTIDDDVENYVNQKYTIHDEKMVIKAITQANGVAAEGAGAKTGNLSSNSNNGSYNGGGNSNYTNNSESKPVDGPLSDYVGDDMDLVYAIVAAECSSGTDMYESAYAVISCIVNRLGNSGFKNNETMTSIVKSPGQWSTFTHGNYLAYYPKSKLQSSRKSAVIQAVDDCIRTGVTSHGFNCFYTASQYYINLVQKEVQEDNGKIDNWNKYCREIGGNYYYKLRGGKYIAEDA